MPFVSSNLFLGAAALLTVDYFPLAVRETNELCSSNTFTQPISNWYMIKQVHHLFIYFHGRWNHLPCTAISQHPRQSRDRFPENAVLSYRIASLVFPYSLLFCIWHMCSFYLSPLNCSENIEKLLPDELWVQRRPGGAEVPPFLQQFIKNRE